MSSSKTGTTSARATMSGPSDAAPQPTCGRGEQPTMPPRRSPPGSYVALSAPAFISLKWLWKHLSLCSVVVSPGAQRSTEECAGRLCASHAEAQGTGKREQSAGQKERAVSRGRTAGKSREDATKGGKGVRIAVGQKQQCEVCRRAAPQRAHTGPRRQHGVGSYTTTEPARQRSKL